MTAAVMAFTGAAPGAVYGQETDAPKPEASAGTCPGFELAEAIPPAPDRDSSPIIIMARELDAAKQGEGEASGNVEFFRADQHIATERLLFDTQNQLVTVPGPIRYEDQQVWLQGDEARYSLLEESGYFSGVRFGLTGSSAHGSAEWAELEGGQTSRMYVLDYTTCPGEDPDWQIQMKELELNHDEGTGSARGAKLEFKGVPILYAPWFSFPIDDRRKSGFLYPRLGHNNDRGIEIGAPWYWNIAPNHDATLTPRWFSNRGFMLTGNYRFLTRRTNGHVDFDYMPDDDETGEERYHYLFRHNARPWRHWSTELVLEQVSDDRFFQDYGNGLRNTSRQFVRSSATLLGVGRYWNFQFMADDFQVIDESIEPGNEPYRRVPRIAFWADYPLGKSGLTFGLDSELVAFDRDVGVTGARLDLFPNIYWDRYNRWGFIKPRIGYRYTAYDLNYHNEPGDESPSRGAGIASLDAGLVFDRFTSDGGYQTLEPRLFYLYVPYEEQDDLPLFDTGEFTFGFSQLFNHNRFTGGDRLGDTNQLSLAVSTRKFDSNTGAASWSLDLGQIVYFDDRQVQIEEEPLDEEELSPFLAEFTWFFSPRISAMAGMQWSWDRNEFDVGTLGARYTGEYGQRVSFDYRYRTERVNQFDFRILWPIGERWTVLSRVKYSFDDDDLLEFQGGFEYESCCWAFRTVFRRYLKNRDGDYRDGFYVELNLKGLAGIGSGSRNIF
jgi:LPS-assembly protein